jgi:hypothetical protein
MIYPDSSVSTKGKKIHTKRINLLEDGKEKNDQIKHANNKESSYKKVSKNVTRTESETEVILKVERHLALIEGDEYTGLHKCPLCGFVLATWNNTKKVNTTR